MLGVNQSPVSFFVVGLLLMGLVGCSDDPDLEHRGPSAPTPIGDGGEPSVSMGGQAGQVSEDGGAGGRGVPPITWCQALVVIENKCQRCHQDPPKNGAPVPLLTYEDTQLQVTDEKRFYQSMLDAVKSGFMPYVALNDPPSNLMPPVEPLTVEEKATLLGWLDQGGTAEGGTDCP